MEHFKLVFKGELAVGKTPEQLRPTLRKALKLSDSAVDKLLQANGKPIALKKAPSLEAAIELRKRFFELGMMVEIQDMQGNPPAASSSTTSSAPSSANRQTPSSQAQTVEPKQPLALTPTEPATPAVSEVATADDEEHSPELEPEPFWRRTLDTLRGYIQIPTFLLLAGLALLYLYSPHEDGFLRNGFLVGIVISIWGYKKFNPVT